MTLEKLLTISADYHKLNGSCQMLVVQLAKFGVAATLSTYHVDDIESAYRFLADVEYHSQFHGELYHEITGLLEFIYHYLKQLRGG